MHLSAGLLRVYAAKLSRSCPGCPQTSLQMSADVLARTRPVGHVDRAMSVTAPHIQVPARAVSQRGGLTRDEVMTASEVAELLHLPVSTVYYLARRGEIPACRLGRAWRFLRPRIEQKLAA